MSKLTTVSNQILRKALISPRHQISWLRMLQANLVAAARSPRCFSGFSAVIVTRVRAFSAPIVILMKKLNLLAGKRCLINSKEPVLKNMPISVWRRGVEMTSRHLTMPMAMGSKMRAVSRWACRVYQRVSRSWGGHRVTAESEVSHFSLAMHKVSWN